MIEKCRKVLNCVIKCDRIGIMTQNPEAAWCCTVATEWLTVGMTGIVIMNTPQFPQNPLLSTCVQRGLVYIANTLDPTAGSIVL
jgi:hypothetical protein